MSAKYQIKHASGRIVQAPASILVNLGNGQYKIDTGKLKTGWSVATEADVAALAKSQADAEASAAAKVKVEQERADRLAAALDKLAGVPAKKGE